MPSCGLAHEHPEVAKATEGPALDTITNIVCDSSESRSLTASG